MSDSHVGRAAARADLCRLLAACYYQPGLAFIEEDVFGSMQAAAEQLDVQMAASARALAQNFKAQSLEELLVDYTRLFLNPTGPLAAPYESFWLGEKDLSRLHEVTQALIASYGEGGFEISEDFRDLPDHIAAELEYLYTLIFKEARADAMNDPGGKIKASELRQRFVASHLGRWVGPFAANVNSAAATSYYRSLATLTERFVTLEAT
ncbi:MAG TPA: molecular chaperone TorD family protein [Burkholderiaceae bacterium]|nr:molecular chaperone TorD family protein [Burkholderiaceae bacterium]HQR77095.1 molecular chaperone TorD family protein [Burkholderiaceae bacterium]